MAPAAIRASDSADDSTDRFSQRAQIGSRKLAERACYKPLFDGRDDRLQHGSLDQSGGLPVGNERLAKTERHAHLAGVAMIMRSRRLVL